MIRLQGGVKHFLKVSLALHLCRLAHGGFLGDSFRVSQSRNNFREGICNDVISARDIPEANLHTLSRLLSSDFRIKL